MRALSAFQPDFRAEAESFALERRTIDAHETRIRLPHFLRQPSMPELATRVREPRLLAAVRAWNWGSGNVLLLGPTRIGKSSAAGMLFRALLWRAIQAGGEDWNRAQTMHWFGAEQLGRARREHPLGQGDAPEVVAACNARLLVLDDVGWDQDPTVVSEVLDVRYERGWPTVMTSGQTSSELTTRYGAAVARRMWDVGGRRPTIVECFQAT